jgi:hypothetical protein
MVVIALCLVGGYASKRLSQDEFAVLVSFAFFLHYLFVRADASHFAPLLPLAAILLPMVFSPGSTGGGELRNLPSTAILTSLIVLLVVAKDFTHRSSVRYEQPISPTSPPTRGKEATNGAPSSTKDIVEETQGTRGRLAVAYGKIERLAKSTPSMLRAMRQGDSAVLNENLLPLDSPLYSLFNEPDELNAIRLVYRLTSRTEPVYVGVRNHARVFINDIRAYWILGRRIAVRHFEMEPGIATEEHVQEEMKRDTEKNAVQWIVLVENKQGDRDFERRAYESSSLLDRFIANEFETVCVFGRYAVLEWNPARARPHCTVGD